MQLNDKGSILITTILIFSIISTICMMCIGLNFSNENIFNLEYKNITLKEESLSGIEIVHSNILKEVDNAIKSTINEEEFNSYFMDLKFTSSIKNISMSNLENVTISVSNKIVIDNNILKFNIISTAKDRKYIKKNQASVKIINPFIYSDNEIDKNKLVIVYDYKEI